MECITDNKHWQWKARMLNSYGETIIKVTEDGLIVTYSGHRTIDECKRMGIKPSLKDSATLGIVEFDILEPLGFGIVAEYESFLDPKSVLYRVVGTGGAAAFLDIENMPEFKESFKTREDAVVAIFEVIK